jgi:hypothetical protein
LTQIPIATLLSFIIHLLKHNLLFHNRTYNHHQRIRKRLLRPNHLHFSRRFHTSRSTHPSTSSLHNFLRNRLKQVSTTNTPPTPSFDPPTTPISSQKNCALPTPLKALHYYILLAWFLPCLLFPFLWSRISPLLLKKTFLARRSKTLPPSPPNTLVYPPCKVCQSKIRSPLIPVLKVFRSKIRSLLIPVLKVPRCFNPIGSLYQLKIRSQLFPRAGVG